ncbi:AAA family ATPase [Ideonella sp. A 288]|uniref:AAA family ATPase n=1 Tax=Ideonella sp. A 288 TaxID=1962181 RepID=UPI0013039C74
MVVAFADIVDSTRWANLLDPEDLSLLFRMFRQAAEDINAAYGPLRLRFTGDAARFTFGHPHFAEDTPETAIRAALALRRALAERMVPGTATPLRVRIGLALGDAVLATLEAGAAGTQEDVVGPVAHLAARLAAAAEPDTVLVDESLSRVAGGFFDFEGMAPLSLKGFDGAVHALRVVAESTTASRHLARREGNGQSAELVGRDVELRRGLDLWQSAKVGPARTTMVIGDPGIGKSRLADRILQIAVQDGATRLDFDCSPRTANTPLHPVRNTLRRLAGVGPLAESGGDTLHLLRTWLVSHLSGGEVDGHAITLALAALEPSLTEAGSLSGERLREGATAALVDIVAGLSVRSPVAILVEDLQWADPTTVELLDALAASTSRWRGILLVTSRPEGRGRLVGAADLEMALEPLTSDDAALFIRQLAGRRSAVCTEETAAWIVARAEGVPLVLEELTRSVLEGRALPGAAGVPVTLRTIVQVRVDAHPERRAVLQAAAVLGRRFSLDMLSTLTDMPPEGVAGAMAQLAADGFLALPAPTAGVASFRHALIHEAVYDTLMRADRRRLHGAVADLLDAQVGSLPEAERAVIAVHQLGAARHGDAARSLLRAAQGTNAAAAYVEAIAHARAGLDALDQAKVVDKATRRELLIQLGVALTARDGYAGDEVERTYRQAREACASEPDDVEIYPVLRGLATFYLVKGSLRDAYELASEALPRALRSVRHDHLLDALSLHGYASLYANRLVEADTMLSECWECYRAFDGARLRYPVPQDAGIAALALLPTVRWLRGRPFEAERAIADGLAHADRIDRPFDRAVLHSWIAGVRYTQRRHAQAREHALIALGISSEFGFATWLGVSALLEALSRAAQAPDPVAVQEAGLMLERMAKTGSTLNAPYYLWAFAQGMARLGQPSEALALLAKARFVADAGGEHRTDAEIEMLEVELAPSGADAAARLGEACRRALADGDLTTALRACLLHAQLFDPDASRRNDAEALRRRLDDPGTAWEPGSPIAALLQAWLPPSWSATGA